MSSAVQEQGHLRIYHNSTASTSMFQWWVAVVKFHITTDYCIVTRGRGVLLKYVSYISYTGMCRPNGLFFHKKSLDKGPLFRGKTLRHGSSFPKCSKFWVFAMQNVEKYAYILRKVLRNGYLFGQKWPLEKGNGFAAAHHRPNQIRVPPPVYWMNLSCGALCLPTLENKQWYISNTTALQWSINKAL